MILSRLPNFLVAPLLSRYLLNAMLKDKKQKEQKLKFYVNNFINL
jgi:hypothetical protein